MNTNSYYKKYETLKIFQNKTFAWCSSKTKTFINTIASILPGGTLPLQKICDLTKFKNKTFGRCSI